MVICSHTDDSRTRLKSLLLSACNDFHYQTSITFGIEDTVGLSPYLFSVLSDLYTLVGFGVRNPWREGGLLNYRTTLTSG